MTDFLKACQMIQDQLNDLTLLDWNQALQAPRNQDRSQDIIEAALRSQSAALQKRIRNEFLHLGPLDYLMEDPLISEILVNGEKNIWIEKEGKSYPIDDAFFSTTTFNNCVDRLCHLAHINVNQEQPWGEGSWKNFRITVIREPITVGGYHLSLRRHPENPWTLSQLQKVGWCTENESYKLKQLLSEKANFLVIGSTSSGKTSVINSLLQLLPSYERAILIEDTSELHLPNLFSMKLLTREDSNGILSKIDQSELVRRALRLRPDRLVIGEIRSGEAKDFLMALATGHAGSFGTIHAQNPQQALIRLEMLIQLGAPQWNLLAIRRLIQLSLQYIVVTEKNEKGFRKFAGLYKIISLEEHGFLIEPVN